MIEPLIQTDVAEFNKTSLKKLKPYFDLNLATCSIDQRHLWFQNSFVLAKHNLSIAHCIQHNHFPRLHIEVRFKDTGYPDFYDPGFENMIGCYSNFKSADSMKLDGQILTGTKQWISLVDRADYGVFRIPVNDTEAYVLIDFASANPVIDLSYTNPIGMEIARPGSITLNNYTLPEDYILGYRRYYENSSEFFHITNMIGYSFTTHYLGLIVALYEEFKEYVDKSNINVDFEMKKIALDIAGLSMTWHDNLSSVDVTAPSDAFWHRRNTQYVLSKQTLLKLVSLILESGDSRWVDAKSPNNQRFRDALTFVSHMKPVHRNVNEQVFVKF
jgi:hypothetical protein